MNPKARPRAILYLRQSVAREESISLELQEDAGRRYADAQGYDVIGVEADAGISGRTWKRPAVQRVMGYIEQGKADVIILWKWSRLSRARLDWAVAIDKVESAGGRIESATEQVDVSTSTGRFARGMLAEFAAFESERIGDTWKEAQARRVAQGLPPNGIIHFGYHYDRDTGYTPHSENGPILRECYLRFLRGESFGQITQYLRNNAEVAHSYRNYSGIWHRNSVISIMDNPFAAGLLRYKGAIHQGAHEPLISSEEWETYQVLREQNRRRNIRHSDKSNATFAGILECGTCGHKYHSGGLTKAGNITMRCGGATNSDLHKRHSIVETKIEAVFLAWLEDYIPKINELAKIHAKTAKPATTDNQAKLRRALLKANDRLDSLGRKYIDDLIPEASYRRLKDELVESIEALERQVQEEKVVSRQSPRRLDPRLLEDWPVMPLETRRQLLRDLLKKVVVHVSDDDLGPGRDKRIEVVPKWAVAS